jgi:hypothetical protein
LLAKTKDKNIILVSPHKVKVIKKGWIASINSY